MKKQIMFSIAIEQSAERYWMLIQKKRAAKDMIDNMKRDLATLEANNFSVSYYDYLLYIWKHNPGR